MPAYIRLLSYFSNFILLASFLGHRRRLPAGDLAGRGCSRWFPVLTAAVIGAVYVVPARGRDSAVGQHLLHERHRRSGAAGRDRRCCCRCCSWRWRRCSRRRRSAWRGRWPRWPPLRAYTLNIAGSLTGVVALRGDLVAGAAAGGLVHAAVRRGDRPAGHAGAGQGLGVPEGIALPPPRRPAPRAAVLVDVALLAVSLVLVHVMARGALWSPYYKITVGQNGHRHRRRGEQHLSPVDGAGRAEGILLPVAVHGVRRLASRTC